MTSRSYFPNYFSIDDIFVTQERVTCQVNNTLLKMGFLDPGSETENLEQGKTVKLPLWYIKELEIKNPYFTVQIPDLYKNIHKAICEADTTNIELGRLHSNFYEHGRYLAPYDPTFNVGRIVSEICRQRVRLLLDSVKDVSDIEWEPEHRFDCIEKTLFDVGIRTNASFANWLKMRSSSIEASHIVQERAKKRKRYNFSDEESFSSQSNSKRK